ncbi:MAG: hypothetical protein ACYS47_03715 [Planctomycetota bacterium]|jgi:hypothetical protein
MRLSANLILLSILASSLFLAGCRSTQENPQSARKAPVAQKQEEPRNQGEPKEPAKPAPDPIVDKSKGLQKEREDDRERQGEETLRTKWKKETAEKRYKRWRVRKGLIHVPNKENAETARSALLKFKEVFGDPLAEQEALESLEKVGKDGVAAIANFMTKDINHVSPEGAMMGTQLFNRLAKMAREHFQYENEFQYGAFESGQEKWNAITEMKMMLLKNGYELVEKK